MVKVGIIGCGKIAEKHLNAYKKIKDVEITVSDIVEKGRDIAKHYGVNWDNNPDQLISREDIDALDICVPTPYHADFIIRGLDKGKHIFCEKPLARNLKEALKIKEKIKHTNRICMVGYLYRFHPAFEFIRNIVSEGIIGDPYYAIFRLGGRGSHKAWKHNSKTGGGAGNEMLVHMLDLAVWYFGVPKKVNNLLTETVLKKRHIGADVVAASSEDLILIEMITKTGVRVLCESDMISPSYMNYIEIHGTNGSVFTSILDYFPTIVYCNQPKGVYDRGHNFFKFTQADLFEKELSYFIDCIKDNSSDGIDYIDDSIKIMEILQTAMHRKGKGR